MLQTLSLFAPELLLAVSASLLLGFGFWGGKDRAGFARYYAIAILVIFALSSFILGRPEGMAFEGQLIVDGFSHYVKLILGFAAAAALLFSKSYFETEKLERYEYSVLTLYCVLGMSIMASANTLLSLYIGIEMQSLALYVMAAFNRDSLRASEAGLKYFVLGALSSGLLLYGASLIYGFTGSLEFAEIAAAVSESGTTPGIVAGMVFLLCGLAFKISAAPFHMWTPDVYEGAPTPVTAFFSAAPKIAAMAIFIRLVSSAFEPIQIDWQQIVVFLSVASMALGAFAAIGQRNIKRLMAYSSIGHMGYALVGLAAGTQAGVRGVIIYMLIYMVMTLGTFACILAMRRKEEGNVENIDELAGLSSTNPFMATMLTILMFSLAGIPPLAGFFGKYVVFAAAIQAELYWLAVIGVLASVVGAYYYLRIIKIMWFDEPAPEFAPVAGELKLVYGLSGLFTLGYIIVASPLGLAADIAARTFF